MRLVTGAILILAAEQAFAQAHLVGFPHDAYVRHVLIPASWVLTIGGIGFLIWGVIADRK